MRRLAVVVGVLMVAVACTQGLPTEDRQVSTGGDPQLLYEPPPSKCTVVPLPDAGGGSTCTASATATPSNYFCGLACDIPQINPVSYVFSKPVYSVDVNGIGSYYCNTEDHGTVSLYSGGKLVEVGQLAIYLKDYYCSPDGSPFGDDSLAQEVLYQSTWLGPIDSLVITRMQPDSVILYWPPWHNPVENTNAVAHTFAGYHFFVEETAPGTATNCLTGNPYLDRMSVRSLLRAMWDSSATGLPGDQRRETGGWVYQDTATGGLITIQQPFNAAFDGPCSSYFAPPDQVGIPLFHVHTHPFKRNDITPVQCWPPNATQDRPGTYNPRLFGGPSEGDIANIMSYGWPEMIVDSTHVYFAPATTTLRNARGVVKPFARHKNIPACDLF